MSLNPDRRIPPNVQVPVYRFDADKAAAAFEAHTALLDQEKRFPVLKTNPVWQIARADVFEIFMHAFGGEA